MAILYISHFLLQIKSFFLFHCIDIILIFFQYVFAFLWYKHLLGLTFNFLKLGCFFLIFLVKYQRHVQWSDFNAQWCGYFLERLLETLLLQVFKLTHHLLVLLNLFSLQLCPLLANLLLLGIIKDDVFPKESTT